MSEFLEKSKYFLQSQREREPLVTLAAFRWRHILFILIGSDEQFLGPPRTKSRITLLF